MTGKRIVLAALISAMALAATACSIEVERNADGSLQVETVITEASLAAEFGRDPLNDNVVVDVQDGFLTVEGDRTTLVGETSPVSFRADVSVQDGLPVVQISEAQFGDAAVPSLIVAEWNAGLSQALERLGRQHPNVTLAGVDLDNDQIAMEWRIETPESRSEG